MYLADQRLAPRRLDCRSNILSLTESFCVDVKFYYSILLKVDPYNPLDPLTLLCTHPGAVPNVVLASL